MKKILFTLALIATVFASKAQNFEGKIKADMKALEVPAEMKGMESMMSQSITMSIKPGKSHMLMQNMMGTTTIITDSSKAEVVMLMDMMGQKTAIKQPLTPDNENDNFGLDLENSKITNTTETKTIAGYKCKKSIIEIMDPETKEVFKTDAWFTDELGVFNAGSPIQGMMMEFQVANEGMVFSYSVTSISKEKIADSLFTIPDGYTLQSLDALQGQFPMMEDK